MVTASSISDLDMTGQFATQVADLRASIINRACETIDPHTAVLRRWALAVRSSDDSVEQEFVKTQLRETWHSGNVVAECLFTMFPDELPVELAENLTELKNALDEMRDLF